MRFTPLVHIRGHVWHTSQNLCLLRSEQRGRVNLRGERHGGVVLLSVRTHVVRLVSAARQPSNRSPRPSLSHGYRLQAPPACNSVQPTCN